MESANSQKKEIRVLVAIDEQAAGTNLVNYLAEQGIFARSVLQEDDFKDLIYKWSPHFIIIDLMYSKVSALMLLKSMKQTDSLKKTKVFVTSQTHNNTSNVKECLRWGASDYLIRPLKHVDILSRIVLHMQEKREVRELSSQEAMQVLNESQFYIHLTSLTLKEAAKNNPLDLAMHNLSKMVSMALKAVRVSIVECDTENGTGIVHGSSDNRDMNQLKLSLNKYPEIIYTLNSQKLLAIDNLDTDPTMRAISQQTKSINFSSIIVVPIETPEGPWGVLSARMPQTRGRFEEIEIQFVQLVAYVLSLVVQKSRVKQNQTDAA